MTSRFVAAAVLCLIVTTGCTNGGSGSPSPPVRPTSVEPMPGDPADVQIGKTYRTRAGYHCGIDLIDFAGRKWQVVDEPESVQVLMTQVPLQITYVHRDLLRLRFDEHSPEWPDVEGVVVELRPTNREPQPCM